MIVAEQPDDGPVRPWTVTHYSNYSCKCR